MLQTAGLIFPKFKGMLSLLEHAHASATVNIQSWLVQSRFLLSLEL